MKVFNTPDSKISAQSLAKLGGSKEAEKSIAFFKNKMIFCKHKSRTAMLFSFIEGCRFAAMGVTKNNRMTIFITNKFVLLVAK